MSFVEQQLNNLDDKRFKNSSAYKIALENNVDSAVLEGNQPDENAGLVKFQELEEGEKRIYLNDIIDFAKDLPRDVFVGLAKGGTNLAQFVNNVTNVLGINPDESYEFIQDKLNNQKQQLMDMEKDSPLINKIISMLPQGTMYTYPIYKKLNNAGIPKAKALILGAAIGETLAFDKAETFFVDSKLMRGLKEAIDIPPGSSYEETFDKLIQLGEYSAYGPILEKLFKGINTVRKLDGAAGQQGTTAVGGGAASGAAVDALTPDAQNVTESEEKKNLNSDDQSMVPGTVNQYGYEMTAGLAPVFRSVLKETAKNIPNKGSGQQILGQITNTPGVKASELKWSGLDDFLKDKKSVTKEEVKEYLENNSLDVSEIQRPRRNTPEEDEQELFLESKLGELDMNIQKYKEANPDALVSNELDTYNYKVRYLGNNFEEEAMKNTSGLLRNLFDSNNLTEDDLLSKFLYKDKVVLHFLRDMEKDPRNLVGSKPYPVEEADRLISQEGFERSSRYEFEPLEVRKYFTNKELNKFNERLVNSGTKFDTPEYTEPGGTDYKEIIFKLKGDRSYPIETETTGDFFGEGTKKVLSKTSFPYRSPSVHFGTKNEFAHVRFKTRDLNGQKVLTVEEMQSDIVQDMKRTYSGQVKDFPFKNNWYELVTKRLIRYAADNDFDAVAIPKGETIADRYKQSTAKAIRVNVKPKLTEAGTDPSFEVTYFGGGNRELKRKTFYAEELNQFEKEIGSKNYSQLKGNIDNFVKNRPEDELFNTNYFAEFDEPLMIGSGKGKVDLYDKSIPSFLKKYGKKWNAKVYDDEISTSGAINLNILQPGFNKEIKMPITVIQLTDDMKKSVQEDSQALFNIFGIGTGATVGTKAVLDDKGNNTISN